MKLVNHGSPIARSGRRLLLATIHAILKNGGAGCCCRCVAAHTVHRPYRLLFTSGRDVRALAPRLEADDRVPCAADGPDMAGAFLECLGATGPPHRLSERISNYTSPTQRRALIVAAELDSAGAKRCSRREVRIELVPTVEAAAGVSRGERQSAARGPAFAEASDTVVCMRATSPTRSFAHPGNICSAA